MLRYCWSARLLRRHSFRCSSWTKPRWPIVAVVAVVDVVVLQTWLFPLLLSAVDPLEFSVVAQLGTRLIRVP